MGAGVATNPHCPEVRCHTWVGQAARLKLFSGPFQGFPQSRPVQVGSELPPSLPATVSTKACPWRAPGFRKRPEPKLRAIPFRETVPPEGFPVRRTLPDFRRSASASACAAASASRLRPWRPLASPSKRAEAPLPVMPDAFPRKFLAPLRSGFRLYSTSRLARFRRPRLCVRSASGSRRILGLASASAAALVKLPSASGGVFRPRTESVTKSESLQ